MFMSVHQLWAGEVSKYRWSGGGVGWVLGGAWCLVLGVWFLVFGAWCLVVGAWWDGCLVVFCQKLQEGGDIPHNPHQRPPIRHLNIDCFE